MQIAAGGLPLLMSVRLGLRKWRAWSSSDVNAAPSSHVAWVYGSWHHCVAPNVQHHSIDFAILVRKGLDIQ